jgi:hypothetical protein
MFFRFRIGKSKKGLLGVAQVPIYYVPFWRTTGSGPDYAVFRPSERTFLHLLKISLFAAVILAVITWYCGLPGSIRPTAADDSRQAQPANNTQPANQAQPHLFPAAAGAPQRAGANRAAGVPPGGGGMDLERLKQSTAVLERRLKEQMSDEEWRQFQREQAAKRKERDRQRSELDQHLARRRASGTWLSVVGRILHWIVWVALVAVAVLPLVAYPLQSVAIARSSENELVIRKRGFWTSIRRWPLENFGLITIRPEEETSQYRGVRRHHGWGWFVRLSTAPTFSERDRSSFVDKPGVEFYVHHQKEREIDMSDPPLDVSRFVKHLKRITGVDNVGKTAIGPESRPWSLFGRRRRTTTTSTIATEPVVTREEYHSLDEVPEHLRADVARLMAEQSETEGAEGESIRVTVRDADGNQQTYTSLDELPPEVRSRYERAMRKKRRKRRRKN